MSKSKFERGKSYPKEEVGTKYKVLNEDTSFPKGAVVTLVHNDGTTCPEFDYKCKKTGNSYSNYEYWYTLSTITLINYLGGKLI